MKVFHLITALYILTILTLTFSACQNKKDIKVKSRNKIELPQNNQQKNDLPKINSVKNDTIVVSKKHNPNFIICNLDDDQLADTVKIVQNTMNKKYGLKIIFGNNKVVYLGIGKDILGQGFDDLEWVGVFEKVPKGEIYWNNVNDKGEIITKEDVNEKDKIKLPHDGIFIHQAEACGGGVIYLNKGKFEWIQQE
ncbi:hypothetical protein [Pedobacter punctiformis]|uniref:Lipoprotein n=1 Tax=Pedobacter punctiformis TaxID=3004097 RepID=A0ABT4L885_9SPHI|nr:hypothetical protein [Pedobacter sp. HCMS5-2]MCZ4244133.1 hypothetical protein [Pedobacter sp. HCMS5-2]